MNDKWIAACGRIIMAGLIGFFGSFRADAQQKFIRLRNETIITEPAKPAQAGGAAKTTEQALSGLRLIQLEGPLQPGWREQLLALHVVLLQYVPDEAFVARVEATPPDELKRLPFVRWVGPFKPEHKLHSLMQQAAAKGGNEAVGVSLLLAADATPQETAGLRQLMLKVAHEARLHFGTILRGQATAGQLQSLALSDKVLWIEPGPKIKLYDEVSSRIVAGPGTVTNHTTMMELGYDGRGVAVAIADTGLYTGDVNDMHPDVTGRVDAAFYYGALTDWSDEHGHGSHVSGIVAGDGATGETDDSGFLYGLGVAPGAHLVVQRIFDGDGNYQPPPTYGTLTRDAVNAGAEIGSNSWGDDTQGRYDLSAMEFDALVRDADELTPGDQAYILEFSAGNAGSGYQTIGSPAVAKNVIATGATESDRADFLIYGDGPDVMADFSSRGPCEDGRIKPDVVAPGTWISSLRSPVGNDDNAWAPISDYYLYEGGTSQAGPHISGAAAVVVQWYREGHTNTTPSPALVKATLINSTVDMLVDMGNAPTPNMDEGWGRVDLTQLIGATRRYDFVDQSVLLRTGQFYERRVIVGTSDEPLKVTLAYTDVPAFPGAIPALVNDLDLEVVAPDGSLYRGNQFLDGESVANAPSADNLNNVEGVLITAPDPGEYIVRVRARNVAQDARRDTTAVDQDFALVISGSIPLPGEGMVMLDRSSYTVPDHITIKVIDSDLAGQTSTTVALSSRTQTNGFNVVLRPSSSAIVFTGSVATALAPAANDGRLHLVNGDWIQAVYYDASAGATRVALAQADLVPPVISGVTVANEYGRVVIQWTTDQAANSVVRFGTNGVLNLSATNNLVDTTHEVELTNIVYGQTYSFVVISTDEAGNISTNSSSGFTFVPVRPATVLLVDSYTDAIFSVPPLSGYTDALAQAGIANDVWNATSRGSPSLGVLRGYRAVIWRVSEFGGSLLGSWTDWNLAEMQVLTNYLAGGGSLLLSSMELISRLGEINANWFVTNILQVRASVTDAGVSQVVGASSDPIGGGFMADLDYTVYEDEWKALFGMPADVSDTITPTTNAAPILYDGYNSAVGLRWPKVGANQPGRLIFLSFPLDAVPMTGSPANNRVALVKRLVNWLAPLQDSSAIEMDSSAYTIPSLVTVEIDAPSLKGQGQAVVHFTNTSLGVGISAAALETVRPGLFRGYVVLVATNGGNPSLQLFVRNGDAIAASFVDPTSGQLIVASASVTTDPPVISNLAAVPSYTSATISWDTSKNADGLVQFGTSALLERTGYDETFATSREILLDGLQPDQVYYYQVVSRDIAGNVATDDNGGRFYTFQTLRPRSVPWFDDMEQGSTEWTVIDSEDTESTWQLGQPQNADGATAHSPMNAWGSDLTSASISQSETFLISPAVFLSGGNTATLRFWQYYDFLDYSEDQGDIFQYGEVMLITNENAAPLTLGEVNDLSDGWEEAEYDLTPYLGNVVYVVWHYFLLSMDYYPRTAWLVDDASITVTNTVPGTILVTNNLFQAAFLLNGPSARIGQGTSLLVTNAPPGEYVVTYYNVPFYQTPPPQTNVLQSSALLVFQSQYTFTDTNHNGIPDAWELQFLGQVAAVHPGTLDTDHDGMSDYAEFIAGTNPTNASSVLRLTATVSSANGLATLTWMSVAGRGYRIVAGHDLLTWVPLTDWQRANNSGLVSQTVAFPANAAPTFYRLEVRP